MIREYDGFLDLENTGNSVDGLMASIDSSVVTGFGIDVIEPDSGMIVFKSDRALEVYPVNPGQSIGFLDGWRPPDSPNGYNCNLT